MRHVQTVLHAASAGFDEKNDALVTVSPANPGEGVRIELRSSVNLQYGRHIEKVILDAVQAAGIQDAILTVGDKGAWDYTIAARVAGAIERGLRNA